MNNIEDKILKIYTEIKENNQNEEQYLLEVENIVNKKLFDLKNNTENLDEEVNFRYSLILEKILNNIKKRKEKILKEKLDKSYKNDLFGFLEKSKDDKADTFIFIFSGTKRIKKSRGYRSSYFALELISRNIPVMYSTWKWFDSDDLISDINDELLFESPIDKTLEYILEIIRYDLNIKNKIFIVSFPYPQITKYIEVLKFYGWTVIYDIMDDWEEFHKVKQASWYKKNHEIYIIEKSDIVTAVSYPLIEKFRICSNKTIELVPNALNEKLFISSLNEECYKINDTKKLQIKLFNTKMISKFKDINKSKEVKKEDFYKNKIGYVGHLTSSWFDWESLYEIANKLPNYTFEIIGNNMDYSINKLPKNIIYLGAKPIEEVTKIAKEWKVGIIPFKIGKLSDGVDPLKIYEYIAMGLNVVSFRMPQIENYPNTKTVETIDEFVEQIQIAMNKEFDYEIAKDFLKVNTWKLRCDTLLSLANNIKKVDDKY